MTSPAQYLTLEDLVDLCADLGDLQIRDLGLLDSAAHRPAAEFAGEQAYPLLEAKAAALLQSIAKNHALVDGNKRLAWTAAVVFLRLNGLRPNLSQADAVALVLDVAAHHVEVATIARGLNVVPLRPGRSTRVER